MSESDPGSTTVTESVIESFAPGTPSWADLASPNIEASIAFYSPLFDWGYETVGPPELTGGYGAFTLRGKQVAGIGPQAEGGSPWWTTYVTTANIDETAAKVSDNGGTVVMEPLTVMDAGRMAIFMDPAGASFASWQPRDHAGAELVNTPGAMCWNELTTRDTESSRKFYKAVFDWQCNPIDAGGTAYNEWKLNDRTIGGMIKMDDNFPPEMPPHWMIYFAVEDADATSQKAVELGGKSVVPPFDTVAGRIAVLNDLHGVVFSVIALSREPR